MWGVRYYFTVAHLTMKLVGQYYYLGAVLWQAAVDISLLLVLMRVTLEEAGISSWTRIVPRRVIQEILSCLLVHHI